MSNSKIKKYDTAINYYQEALKLNPNHPLTLFHLGVVFQDIFDFDSSIKYYKKAIKVNSNYIDPLFNLSFIHKDLGNYKEAVNLLKKIILINPNYLKAYQCMSEIICEYKYIFSNKINLKILKKQLSLIQIHLRF